MFAEECGHLIYQVDHHGSAGSEKDVKQDL